MTNKPLELKITYLDGRFELYNDTQVVFFGLISMFEPFMTITKGFETITGTDEEVDFALTIVRRQKIQYIEMVGDRLLEFIVSDKKEKGAIGTIELKITLLDEGDDSGFKYSAHKPKETLKKQPTSKDSLDELFDKLKDHKGEIHVMGMGGMPSHLKTILDQVIHLSDADCPCPRCVARREEESNVKRQTH